MFYLNKKSISKKFSLVISALLIASVVIALGAKPFTIAQTADELQRQKAEKQKALEDIEKKIADYQTEIKATQKQANTLANQIKILNLEIASTQQQIEVTGDKIDVTNMEIADVTEKIIDTQRDIAGQKAILKSLIADINDLDQRSPLEIALENDNFDEFLDQVQYVTSIQQQSQESLTKIKQLESDLEDRQTNLKNEKDKLDELLAQLDLAKANLAGQQRAKQQVLDQTRGQERAYQRLLTDQEKLEKALENEINDLDSQISAKLGNTKLKPLHGLLAYPMKGTMTQGYGNTGFTSLGYSFHNGIDIAAPAGTPIYASGDGVVEAVGTGQGAYGNWVAIKHSTGKFANRAIISLYGHMSSFRVKDGQVVKMGDLVGFEGNTGNTTRLLYGPHRGYHLHFTIFDARGFGVAPGANTKSFGPYMVPYGAPYNPLDFL
ncbi:MAG: peptidoglycan DD-metalloendopeptidase family protein [Candidatus Doudnabacteria bacterium]|nr:peptidoglycan DD-metalloendopeptidase family protein [Candidatus Doudnabacteria bacterium]